MIERCVYCGSTEGPFHLDHVVPRSRGGPDDPSNLVQACVPCNSQKRDKLPSEWYASRVPDIPARIERDVCTRLGNKLRGRRESNKKRPEPALPGVFSARDVLLLWDLERQPTVKVRPFSRDDQSYHFSALGAYSYVQGMSDTQLRRHCLWQALVLMVDYGIPPKDVHSAMLDVAEYRQALQEAQTDTDVF